MTISPLTEAQSVRYLLMKWLNWLDVIFIHNLQVLAPGVERWGQYHLRGGFAVPFAFFINCWIHWLSIGSFSVPCYTTIELQPRCHPSFLMRTGDCGAALLPWQQALSHSPHIVWSVHVVPSKPERAAADTGLLSDRIEPGLFTSCSDNRFPPNPTAHASFSILFITNASCLQLVSLSCWTSNFLGATGLSVTKQ